jgi:hypothetical protein
MSLPVCQQRVLDRMEDALRASEPHLTSMYAIFSRLNTGEPVRAERLVRKRQRWLRQGTAMYAIVLMPVMFAAIIIGALLSGGARSANACEASYSVGGVSPLASRPSCPTSGRTGKAMAVKTARKTITATARRACVTAGTAARFTILARDGQVLPPFARVAATAAQPGTC